METEMFLLMSIVALQRFGETFNDIELVLMIWMSLQHPDWFTEPYKVALNSLPVQATDNLKSIPRHEFYEAFVGIRRKQGIH